MTRVQYVQEYLGEFVDELMQFFPTELIKKCMILQRSSLIFSPLGEVVIPVKSLGVNRFLGVDVARMGSDESVLISVERINRDRVKMIDMEITTKTLLTETILRIKETDKKYDFKKIYIDDGGMGVGVFDPLISDEQTKRKIVGINNATRSIDKENKRKKKLLKEDLYTNLLRLMEQGKVELFDEPEIMLSLKSIQYENTDDKSMKIYGNYSHITEALVRSCWWVKDKTLNIYIY
jgi:hypothetical protein